MKRNFDKFLLGLLWLMTVALATTFWMNTRYGFDIFSAAHWEYLSGLQADRANIKPEFYVSLIIALCIGLIGLYTIVRPRFRKIPMPTESANAPMPAPDQPAPAPQTYNNYANVGGGMRPRSPSSVQSSAMHQPRPQTIPQTRQQQFTPPTQRVNMPTQSTPGPRENPLANEIKATLESAEFIMKPCKRIGKLNNPVVALGYNQVLWIVTSNDSYENMIDAFQTLSTVFEDTLGDSANDITLRGCIISPTTSSNHEMISPFNDIGQFKQFMNGNKNTKPDNFDKELFDAISTYVSTVANYIGKE